MKDEEAMIESSRQQLADIFQQRPQLGHIAVVEIPGHNQVVSGFLQHKGTF
jgi:hypothetical protein